MWLLFFLACGSSTHDSEKGDSVPVATDGTLSLTFRMDDDYLETMPDAAVGTFRGSIYAEADASAIGPNEGAASLQDFTADGVDLTVDGGPADVVFVTDPLPVGIVWILGCLDVDGNDCDAYDPITIPNENKTTVEGGVETPFEVYMGMLNPS